MPNCDWGRPCDCIECSTKIFSIKCPSCNFETSVSYVSGSEGSTDRKGIWGYSFQNIETRGHTLDCYKCGFHMTDVPYYEKIEKEINDRILSERTCEGCYKKEFASIFPLEFKDWNGKLLCLKCIDEKVKSELTDPSSENKRFKFNLETLKYELDEVKLPCVDCGKKRWIKANEQWRKQCLPCYKKARNYY